MSVTNGQRVFCVGMNKTGTSTLGQCFAALRILPLASPSTLKGDEHPVIDALLDRGDYEPALRLAERFRSFEDRPWNLPGMFEQLDRCFPGSLFILSERDPANWWRSVDHWLTRRKPQMLPLYRRHLRLASWGRDQAVEAYLAYNRSVRSYFGENGRLLVMDLERGDGWDKLCAFLGCPVPDAPFPHANRQAYDEEARRARRAARRRRSVCRRCGAEMPRYATAPPPPTLREAVVGYGIDRCHQLAARGQLRRAGRRSGDGATDGLAVVTSYFNPCRYVSRRENYQLFREGIRRAGVPLLTVELAVGGRPHELEGQADDLLRLDGRDVMWHKERLLNVGIRELLRRGYHKIVWLDCDILFDDEKDWPERVAEQLETTPVCQVFTHLWQCPGPGGRGYPGVGAVWYAEQTGRRIPQLRMRPLRGSLAGTPLGLSGHGWAATADVLSEVPLYEHAIVGGADRLMYLASFKAEGAWEADLRRILCSHKACAACGHRNESEAYTRHALAWARRWSLAVDGRVGAVAQRIRHCYHGQRAQRGYMRRREILFTYAYDPEEDVTADGDGCWQWASGKHGLHRDVAAYFSRRAEDG